MPSLSFDDTLMTDTFADRLKLSTGQSAIIAMCVLTESGAPKVHQEEMWFVESRKRFVIAPPSGDPMRVKLANAGLDAPKPRFATAVLEYARDGRGQPVAGNARALEWQFSPTVARSLAEYHLTHGLGKVDLLISRPRDTAYEVKALPGEQQRWRGHDGAAEVVAACQEVYQGISMGQRLDERGYHDLLESLTHPGPAIAPTGVTVAAPAVDWSDAVATATQRA